MPSANRTRLMHLADREFRRGTDQPAPTAVRSTFKGMRLDISRFDELWDRRRGAAMRMTAIVLNEDSELLLARVCAGERETDTYAAASDWLTKEAQALRKAAKMHEAAATRLRAVIERCRGTRAPASALPA